MPAASFGRIATDPRVDPARVGPAAGLAAGIQLVMSAEVNLAQATEPKITM